MALPTAYLTSIKNLAGIFAAIQGAQAPEKFTQAFLESLEFKSNSDRLIINLLKALGFLDDSGKPKDRYFRFLDQTQGPSVLAEAIREAYLGSVQSKYEGSRTQQAGGRQQVQDARQGGVLRVCPRQDGDDVYGACEAR